MAVPKRKTSKSVRDRRRSHDKLKASNIVTCPRCHSKKLAHRVCEECGYYGNKEIISFDTNEKSKNEAKEKAGS